MSLIVGLFWALFFALLVFAVFFVWTSIGLFIAKVPPVSSSSKFIRRIGKHLKIKKGDKICDAGSGNGKFLLALNKEYGCECEGFEIAQSVWFESVMRKTFSAAKEVRFFRKNFHKVDLSKYDIIYNYLFPPLMGAFEEKLQPLKGTGKRVISHAFRLPNLRPYKTVRSREGTLRFYVL